MNYEIWKNNLLKFFVVLGKSKVEISQNFVAFSEYTHYILRATLKSNEFLD